ncbi:MAG: barstar family protein [Gimesia chilikensis]
MKTYEIDGNDFSNLAEFAEVFSKIVLRDHTWNGNLNAFDDLLRGGFGTPDEGFKLIWKNSNKSRKDLGFPETERWYEEHYKTCHPSNQHRMLQGKDKAHHQEGETVFDWLIEIIKAHGPGGTEQEDGVILQLEEG